MRLYNTLTRSVVELEPLHDKVVRMYSCGPTVYDHVHIGNLSSFIYADTLRRVIETSGQSVKHVMNFTDVDDKTIKRSREEIHDATEPMEALHLVTERYSRMFLEDMDAIGNDTAKLTFVKASDSIAGMQELITKLVHRQFAYIAEDGVYFSIEAYRRSGKTYGQLLELTESTTSEARIDNDEYDKESLHDFALWKLKKEGEPYWPFDIDGQQLDGRPGWHIECSAMSQGTLGVPFDIHTGGIDLIFPHHENEIAQSTALSSDALFARIFFHNEHLLVDGKKMSKSLGNFLTLETIRSRGIDPLAFRVAVLQSHYRSQSNFTMEGLEAAQNYLKNLQRVADLRFQLQDISAWLNLEHIKDSILTPLQDDAKTPLALAALSEFVHNAQEKLISIHDEQNLLDTLTFLDELFGLKLRERQDCTSSQKETLVRRAKARTDQDWAESDRLRDELTTSGLSVRDTSMGQVWERL